MLTLENGLDLAGVTLLVTVIIDLLKYVPGLIKDGEKVANAVQTVVTIILTLLGMFAPDLLDFVPMFDNAAALLAEFGGYVLLAIPVIIRLANFFHDMFSKVPVAKVAFKRLT